MSVPLFGGYEPWHLLRLVVYHVIHARLLVDEKQQG